LPGADFDIHIEHEADRYTIPSKKGMTRANQMTEIHKIITSAGWLDKSPDGHSKVDLDEVDGNLSGFVQIGNTQRKTHKRNLSDQERIETSY
jgi:hypothetical protein